MDERELTKRREEMRKRSLEEAEAAFTLAGWTIAHRWELANGYWPDSPDYDDVRSPWWLFLTPAPVGLIRWGRRKRVIEIEWAASAFRGIVTTDDVTKSDTYVHAHTVEDAVTYLRILREIAHYIVSEA